MANAKHLKILKQGVEVWNRWRKNNAGVTPKLSGATLINLNLKGVDLSYVDLSEAYISRCDLSRAVFTNASMSRVQLNHIELVEANLKGIEIDNTDFHVCNLEKATLEGTMLSLVDFRYANFKETNFNRAVLYSCSFSNADLSLAKSLETIRHVSPSTIGIDTLYNSGGKIPEIFLRGCGVPDDFITFIPSHFGVQQAIQFYSCFISYSTRDEEFARRLYSRMRDEKLRVWFAPEDIKAGRKLHEQIELAIQLHDRLLIILSEESMQSEWVRSEIRNARQVEIRENRQKLFPIGLADFESIKKWKCFDSDTGKDLAVELREYYIPDFSNWKDHDAFEKGFERLLRDLRAEEKKQAEKRA